MKLTEYEIEKRWQTPEGISGVLYPVGDALSLQSEDQVGRSAEVIALIALEPPPISVMVFDHNEESLVVYQSELQLVTFTREIPTAQED